MRILTWIDNCRTSSHILPNSLKRITGLWPASRCLLCPLQAPKRRFLCEECESTLPRLLRSCSQCGIPLGSNETRCGHCLQQRSAIRSTVCALTFADSARDLVHQFKYSGNLFAGKLLTNLLSEKLRGFGQTNDMVCCIPQHPRRLLERGFNQSAFLARHVSRELAVDYMPGAIRRTKYAPPLHAQGKKARQRHLRGAFSVCADVAGLRIALVDDVVTTGATTSAIAQNLLDKGAASVDVWAAARTVSKTQA